nr:MAG TPA: 60S acidic ribosomal protein P0 [Caudoviricetes sp.]
MKPSVHEGRRCPHAASCFECPLPDCRAGMWTVAKYNRLPHEKCGSELWRKWSKTMRTEGEMNG